MARLFFAFEFSQQATPVLTDIQHQLQRAVRDERARWTPMEQWHITTHFLGDVTREQEDALIDAMSLLPQAPVTFTTWELDVFPSRQQPRAFALRLADVTTEAFKQQHAQIPIILRAGLQVDSRPWKPHVTLGRIHTGRSQGRLAEIERIHVPQYTFNATQLTLFESNPQSKVRYAPLASIDLPRG